MVLLAMIILLGCKNSIKGRVVLKCIYMGYACGECDGKYKIEKIIKHEYALAESIQGADLQAVFKFSNQERDVDNLVKDCAICYDYYFSGSLSKSSGKDYYTISIDSVNVLLRNDSCCDKK